MIHPFFKRVFHILSKETLTFLGLAALIFFMMTRLVDLTPHVENDFFFSSDDPTFQADKEITKLFPRKDSQIIISISGDIFADDYRQKVHYLSDLLLTLETVTSVKSITHGPGNITDAMNSPLWKRILINDNWEATNVLMMVEEHSFDKLIPRVENLISVLDSEDFRIRISGFPYIVELIRRNLIKDLNLFSTLALILFSIVAVVIFHSLRIFIGIVATCATSCCLTLMITGFVGIKIGVLTANLATIIFVLTLSHIVFLTFNWKSLTDAPTADQAAREAIDMTLLASFWAMVTTLLGFVSLLFVYAKPLRELGISGALGTVVAFICAYSIYPAFLRLKKPTIDESDLKIKAQYHKLFDFCERYRVVIIVLIFAIITLTAGHLKNLNTDPSLISYFQPKSEITEGLKYIDRNGGSSPLVLVLKDTRGKTLNTNKIYKRLWALQEDLEAHSDIGTIISLPTLLAEGKRVPLGFLFASEWLLNIMELPMFDRIAASFITQDRQYGLFLLRMNELNRVNNRLVVMEQVRAIVREHDFDPYLMGGVYSLQGQMSKHIAASLIAGLGRLILIFTFIAFIVSRSIRIGLSMTLSIALVPLCLLGVIGLFYVPLDTISAPAANVAISMGIDAMIHMVNLYRRLKKQGYKRKVWLEVRRRLWEPILTSTIIVCSGFGIFFFSSFPPTQRFGVAIVFGTVIASLTALFIFPLLAKKE